jgi:ABC-type branched-subunit amino acid transport system substrate-binding protein
MPLTLRSILCAIAALAAPAAADGRDLVVGQVVDYAGKHAEESRDYVAGARTYFDWINQKGGVNGMRIRHQVVDGGSGAVEVRARTRQLLDEQRADVLFGYVGDEAVEALAGGTAAGVALVGPLAGREAPPQAAARIFFTRPSYDTEVRQVIAHFKALQVTRFAMVKSAGEQGRIVGELAERALSAQRLRSAGSHVLSGQSAVEADAQAVLQLHAQAVIVIADTVQAAEFIKRYRPLDPGAMLVALSTVNHRTLFELLGPSVAHGVMITQVVPNPMLADSPLLKEHLDAMRTFRDEPPSHLTLEGFIAAKALVEGVRRAGAAPTREKILAAFQRAGPVDLNGVVVDFDPRSRSSARGVELAMIRRNGGLLQ